MLTVYIPPGQVGARRYSVQVLLGEFLGIPHTIEVQEGISAVEIVADGRTLEVCDLFFRRAVGAWLTPASLPVPPLDLWDTSSSLPDALLIHAQLPVIFGEPLPSGAYYARARDRIVLGVDLFGSAFFMLTRLEEMLKRDRDDHDRFPAVASIAYQEGFLDRPIVNEYVELLWACLRRLWPGVSRRHRTFRKYVTADVDHPYHADSTRLTRQLRQIGKAVIQQKSPARAMSHIKNFWHIKRGDYRFDPYHGRLAWMMDVNERAGHEMLFYLMSGRSDVQRDAGYTLDEPVIRRLIRAIKVRGHAVGLHPSYGTYRDTTQLRREVDALRRVLDEERFDASELESRQHYLRWHTPTTARCLEAVGVHRDSTLGFADRPGFRCGVCFEFPLFDLKRGVPSTLKERPLIVMECSVMGANYMNLGATDKTLATMRYYHDVCRTFGGDFVLLWHNSYFDDQRACAIYRQVVNF